MLTLIFLFLALCAVLAYNVYRWQQDKTLADRLREKTSSTPRLSQTPKVSVLVAAWNEQDCIDAHICSFLALTYPDIELILCAGGTDGTFECARQYAGPKVVVLEQQQGEGKQRALARCLEYASGEIIYLIDADCLYDENALIRLLDVLVNENEVAATGRYSPLQEQRENAFASNQWAVDTYARARSGKHVGGLIGRNAALTRLSLEDTEALKVDVPIGTDQYLSKLLLSRGKQIRYVHESMVATQYHTNIRPYLRQQSRWLRNIILHGRHFGAQEEVMSAELKCAIGMTAVGLPLLFPLIGPIAIAVWLLGLIFASVNRVRYLKFSQRCGQVTPPRAFLSAPLYALLDLYTLANAGWEMILGRQYRW
ncbi:MAG: glycosyltransferase [Chloroflexi bacterium]|nr:MAG: glycosyltransferase [Chloroflexota bacterium]